MSKIYVFLGAALFSGSLFSLEEAPWLGDVYGFNMHTDFSYSQYSKIDHAIVQPAYAYNNYLTQASVGAALSEKMDVEIELEMARTPHQTYGFRSSAIQGRFLVWDDIAGDPVTVAVGLNTRAVSGRSVRDVSSPYASYWNGEATASIGKEFTKEKDWKTRGYLLASVGLANHGSWWNRCDGAFESKIGDSQSLELFALGYVGYGGQKNIDIGQFKGWGFIRHRSLDLGIQYRYFFDFWGALGVSYSCRVLAISYPKGEQTIQVSYALPFSLF